MPRYPNTIIERELWSRGFQYVAGVDEAGRGAWAGPLVVGLVVLPPDFKIKGLRDSKLLRAKQRQELALKIKKQALAWHLEQVSPPEIDRLGIYAATVMAMQLALQSAKPRPDAALLDAVKIPGLNIHRRSIIGGDRKITTVAAASILAKVERDRLLEELGQKYARYDFAQHKGYGTKQHQRCLQKFGPCPAHRFSYQPIWQSLQQQESIELET